MAALSVLFLGTMSGTCRHRRDAFRRLGHEVVTIEPRELLPRSAWVDRIEWHLSPTLLSAAVERRIAEQIGARRFDLAFADNGSLFSPRLVRRLRQHCRHVVNFNHDDPFGPRDRVRFSAFRAAVPEYDLVVVGRTWNVAEALAHGARKALYFPRIADEVAHAPRPIDAATARAWAAEVAFIGTWMPERGPFMLDLIERGVPLTLYGQGWHKAREWPRLRAAHRAEYVDGDAYAYAIQCARVSLGLLSLGNRDQHTTRSIEIPLLGGLLCAQRTPEHRQFYDEGREALFWDDSAECARRCLEALADEPRRQRIAAAGRERALRNGYTSEHLIRAVLRELA